MRVKRKIIQVICLAALTFVMAGMVGCSGINTTHSISPATFLLPGFGSLDAPRTPPSFEPAVPIAAESPARYN